MHFLRLIMLSLVVLAASCGTKSRAPATVVRMQFERVDGFYAAPFPSEDLRRDDGTIAMPGFPNPTNVGLVAQSLTLITRDARGFALAGAAFLALSGEIDATRLPDLVATTTEAAPIFLMGIDPAAPDFLKRYPTEVSFEPDGGPFGEKNLLSLLPLQGRPLREHVTYAAVVTRRVLDARGQPLGVSAEMSQLASGARPAGMSPSAFEAYQRALAALAKASVPTGDIAGLAVFTSDTPSAGMAVMKKEVLARPSSVLTRPLRRTDVFPDFCVYASTIAMPVYQAGTPPYDKSGGGWAFDAAGRPVFQRFEEANFFLTLPRTPVPASGFPAAVLVRAGGAGVRPLVDRGRDTRPGGGAPPGTGPALHFARAGSPGSQWTVRIWAFAT